MPDKAQPSTGNHVGKPTLKLEITTDIGFMLNEAPPAPLDLNDEGIFWWEYYTGLYVEGNILSRLFLTSIHNLCILHMVRHGILQELAASPDGVMLEEYYVNRDKEVTTRRKLNPLSKDLSRICLDMDKLLASLGMTAYTQRINAIDTGKGGSKGKDVGGPPPSSLPPQKLKHA